MLRGGTATAAGNQRPGLNEEFAHEIGKNVGGQVIDSLPLYYLRQSGVGLDDQR